MTISKTDTGREAVLALAGTASVREAGVLRDALLECCQSRLATTLDVGALEAADVTTLQLVLAASRTFADEGVPLRLRDGGGSPFRQTCLAAGLEGLAGELEP